MLNNTEKKVLLKKIIRLVYKKAAIEQHTLLDIFIHRYYANVAYDDLLERKVEDLAGAVLSHWNFIYQRAVGEMKVRVYNPSLAEDGWSSKYTIVEISHDDMPFLVDSSRLEITRHNIAVQLAIHTGGIKLQRNTKNQIIHLFEAADQAVQFTVEAPIHFEINRITDPILRQVLRDNIERVLSDVRFMVEDWQLMLSKVQESIDDLEKNPPNLPANEITESKLFLRWLIENHFTFLSCRDYILTKDNKGQVLKMVTSSGLGIHRDKTTSRMYRNVSEMPMRAQSLLLSPQILIMAKTNTKSTVHRDTYTDYIGIKRFNDKNQLIGERRFIGLYTSSAYNETLWNIPFLRHKVEQIFVKSGLLKNSHTGKVLMDILESFPRDDLFQASIEELAQLCIGIVNLQERDKVRLFARKDMYNRYFSCLVYVPRDRYNTKLQQAMQQILEDALRGKAISVSTSVGDSALARIHYIIHLGKKTSLEYDFKNIEQQLIAIARSWHDELADFLIKIYGDESGNKLFSLYKDAFPTSYCESYRPQIALADIKYLEQLTSERVLEIGLYQLETAAQNNLHLKIFKLDGMLPLSMVMPILESLGLSVMNEHPYKIVRGDGKIIWIHDFDTNLAKTAQVNLSLIKDVFKEAFKKIYLGEAENDGFNRLVLLIQLTWRETALLRALAKYARQIKFNFSQSYIENTLVHYSDITQKIVALFILRFDPRKNDKRAVQVVNLEKNILNSIEKVSSLDEDTIFRFYFALINSILRTNFFQKTTAGTEKNYFSFKFCSEKIPDLPLPKPKYEIFVYASDFEAVHLRAEKVARGGLRWSDRPEDFRTEVLGLMKAQHVKNAVIIPAGAKGGFYPKKLPKTTDRNLINTVAIQYYKNFIRGMLDITDNLKAKKIVPPLNVICYDDNDPYLVVAADKGTATFSDIANQISAEYNFWLGDAFASGGSFGYDHKKMGITARGAWESVKRHFNHLGVNIQTTDFTVIGIGDMSGDVFGNGMLLSKHIKLLGAFNHQHIFIDPNPEPSLSFKERQRLFNLPRSSWSDYSSKLISKGGGVFERRAKSIMVSPEMATVFGLHIAQIEPNELIRVLLRSKIDLLFNGGIGTYVKSTQENDFQVGDKTNDAVRINATELGCKIVGEGGNLGFTQLARIEYALNGGYIYTDSLDNSAGVNCSDHEVNLKILLNDAVSQGELKIESRNKLLPQLTDEIAQLVLRDNYNQAQAIDLGYMRAKNIFDIYQRYINELSETGALNQQLEFLPDNKTLAERQASGTYLTKPELVILFAYTKIFLKNLLLKTDIPDNSYFADFIKLEFPTQINQKFTKHLHQHSLRREIVATQISNTLVNEMGCVFVYRLMDETGASAAEIVRAYAAVRDIFAMPEIWQKIATLDGKINSQQQLLFMLRITQVLRHATRWVLNYYRHQLNVAKIVDKFAADVQGLFTELPKLLTGESKLNLENKIETYRQAGVPLAVATNIACIDSAFAALDMVAAAQHYHLSINKVAKVCFILCDELDLIWLRYQINLQTPSNQWDTLSLAALRDQLDDLQSTLAINVLRYTEKHKKNSLHFSAWQQQYKHVLDRWRIIITSLKQNANVSMIMLFISLKELADLVSIMK